MCIHLNFIELGKLETGRYPDALTFNDGLAEWRFRASRLLNILNIVSSSMEKRLGYLISASVCKWWWTRINMARNQEKAQSMLYRFRESQAAELGIKSQRRSRPRNITSITDVAEAEKWRGTVIRDISRKMMRIQDPALSDYQIRDTNDLLNKLMKEKYLWEVQLRNIGGPNYTKYTSYEGGAEISGNRGYQYYGRAKDLPGVKELFDSAPSVVSQANKDKILFMKNMDARYYGYLDEDEDMLAEENRLQSELIAKQEQENDERKDFKPLPSHFHVPSQDEVEKFIVERRQKMLIDAYT